MQFLDQDNPDSWPRMLSQHCPVKLCESCLVDQVIFLRKSFQLIIYAQLMGIVLFLILTSNVNMMTYFAQGDGGIITGLAIIGLFFLIILIGGCQGVHQKYDIVFMVIVNFLIEWVFSQTCCYSILEDPSSKQSQLLFLVANILYILGLMCLTYRIEWHKSLCLTYILYTIGFSIVFNSVCPDSDALVFIIFCIIVYGTYMLVEIVALLKGCRFPNLISNDHATGALIIQFDFLFIAFALLRAIINLCSKFIRWNPDIFDQQNRR